MYSAATFYVAKMNGDDPADSARYGLKAMPGDGHKPIKTRVMEKVHHLEDLTSRALHIRKVMEKERKAAAPVQMYRRGRLRRWT